MPVEVRKWVHVTGTVQVTPQTAIMSLYINGELKGREAVGNITMCPFDSSISLFVGTDEEKRIIPLRYYTGLLDELRYFSFVLSLSHQTSVRGEKQLQRTGSNQRIDTR